MYDQRLFNQEGGLQSGLAAEDTYNVYDKPLYADRGSNLYRPNKAAVDDEDGADIPADEVGGGKERWGTMDGEWCGNRWGVLGSCFCAHGETIVYVVLCSTTSNTSHHHPQNKP